jgi:hypothetical protein
MRDTASFVQFGDAGLDLVELAALRLDERRDRFGRQVGLRPARPLRQRLEPLLRRGVDANREGGRDALGLNPPS